MGQLLLLVLLNLLLLLVLLVLLLQLLLLVQLCSSPIVVRPVRWCLLLASTASAHLGRVIGRDRRRRLAVAGGRSRVT